MVHLIVTHVKFIFFNNLKKYERSGKTFCNSIKNSRVINELKLRKISKNNTRRNRLKEIKCRLPRFIGESFRDFSILGKNGIMWYNFLTKTSKE